MRKTRHAEDRHLSIDALFEPLESGGLASTASGANAVQSPGREARILDGFLTAIKWLFLYVPGAWTIHLLLMGCALLFFYSDASPGILLVFGGTAAVAAFMIMLGVGKLSELKYLRVVGGITAVSALAAIMYLILASFVAGDFWPICEVHLAADPSRRIHRQTLHRQDRLNSLVV